MRISDWSSDVCSSDLGIDRFPIIILAAEMQSGFTAEARPVISKINLASIAFGLAAHVIVGQRLSVERLLVQRCPRSGCIRQCQHRQAIFPGGTAEDRKSTRLNSSH